MEIRNKDFSQSSFIHMCACLAESFGECKTNSRSIDHFNCANEDLNYYVYENDIFRITLDQSTPRMTITRKENNNPVVFIDDFGKSYRHNGEYTLIYNDVVNEFMKKFQSQEN